MRRTLILGGIAVVAAMGFMLTLGAWRSGDLPWQAEVAAAATVREADLRAMSWQLTRHDGQQVSPQDGPGRRTSSSSALPGAPMSAR